MFLCVNANDSQNCSKNKHPAQEFLQETRSVSGTVFAHVIYVFLRTILCL